MKLHYKQEMKYLNAVADYLISLGYQVEQPDSKNRDLLDVWGTVNGKKCFLEIYVTIYTVPEWNGSINGIWHQGEHEGVEMFLSSDPNYGLDTRNYLEQILDGLKPFKKGKILWKH